MKIQLSNKSSKYGAGTRTSSPLAGKCYLQRLKWVDYDYDEGGAYWGYVSGTYIFAAQDAFGNQAFYRAKSREDAKAQILGDSKNKNVSFFK